MEDNVKNTWKKFTSFTIYVKNAGKNTLEKIGISGNYFQKCHPLPYMGSANF